MLFCNSCRSSLISYTAIFRPPSGLESVYIAYVFQGALRRALHQLKYRRVQRMAMPLGALLAEQLAMHPCEIDVGMPIPLHPKRLAERGFNQAEKLAEVVASVQGMRLVTDQLVRVRATEQQILLGTAARIANVQGAFEWRSSLPPPLRILLIDDVMTTGATLSACAQVLLAAGAEKVYGAVLARSQLDR